MTKYFGVTLIPLLLVYSLTVWRRLDRRICYLLIPIIQPAGFELLTWQLYGHGLIGLAMTYLPVGGSTPGPRSMARVLTGLSFTGGCLIAVALYAPLMLTKRWWTIGGVLVVVSAAALLRVGCFHEFCVSNSGQVQWSALFQLVLLVSTGVLVLALACEDFRRNRTPISFLLLAWTVGTFCFATFLNWSSNARSVFPMAPAAGTLVVRRLELLYESSEFKWKRYALLPLLPAACVSLLAAWVDYSLADCQRRAARKIVAEFAAPGRTVWFQGHWGFQYHMELLGSKAYDVLTFKPRTGDMVVVPINNTNLKPLPDKASRIVGIKKCTPCRVAGTMNKGLGAGFYTEMWGPFPFAAGLAKPEEYVILEVIQGESPGS